MNFNPEQFMESAIQGAMDTRRIPCPTGDFPGVIEGLKAKSGEISKGERIGQTWAAVEVTYKLTDPAITAATGMPSVLSRQFIGLDLTPEGNLDMGVGKNIRIGKLREACGENDGTRPFAWPMLVGKHVICKVGHRADETDPTIVYDEVVSVRKP